MFFLQTIVSDLKTEELSTQIRLTPFPISVENLLRHNIDLNGKWMFNPEPDENFWKVDNIPGKGWNSIQVPGEWVMQGFTVPEQRGAGYRLGVAIPDEWTGKRVKIRFDGVYSFSKVWINDQEVGKHDGGFSPFEYDITEQIQPGSENILALTVENDSPAGRLSNQSIYAAHPVGGIIRKVSMFVVPQVHISRFHVETYFDEKYSDATLKILLNISNESEREVKNYRVQFSLSGPDGKQIMINPDEVIIPEIEPGNTLEQVIEIPVTAPLKWDAEHPNLYTLFCELTGENIVQEMVSRRFGFRQVEIQGNQVFVNGKHIKLRGVCRHETHPLFGRSLKPGLWRKDAEIFREANINYIRTSHYPPAEEFIEACDESGLFVEEEAPFCFVGLEGQGSIGMAEDPQYEQITVQVTLEMIERDRSHPSVIFWSVGNESNFGRNFVVSSNQARKADTTRPILVSAWNPDHDDGELDISAAHYPGHLEASAIDHNPADQYADSSRPIVFDEFCHLNCYNHAEIITDPGLRDYWGLVFTPLWEGMYKSKVCIGGAIWSGVDDIFYVPSGIPTPYVGYGEWGLIDGWRREKPEYWHVKKSYSPVRIFDREIRTSGLSEPLSIEIENRYDFTNLNEIHTEWTLGDESGTVKLDIAPRNSGLLSIQPQMKNPAGKELVLRFYHQDGYLIDAYKLPVLGCEDSTVHRQTTVQAAEYERRKPSPILSQDDTAIIVQGEHFEWAFDRKTGLIKKGAYDGKTVIAGGPVLTVTPLKPEKDVPLPQKDWPEPYNVNCTNWIAKDVKVSQKNNTIILQIDGTYDEASGLYTMQIDGDGRLNINYSFVYQIDANPREIGVTFAIDSEYSALAWKRRAQWTYYPEDHIGRAHGESKAFRGDKWSTVEKYIRPPWPWSLDSTSGGTNDFRSTKRNILWAFLKNHDGTGIKVLSDGHQSVRAHVDSDHINLLCCISLKWRYRTLFSRRSTRIRTYRAKERF